MATPDHVLDVARGELGTAESPAGSDSVLYNAWYYGRPVGGGTYPWCAVFVSWVADRAGADEIPRHAYTPTGAAWFQQRRQWSRTPRVGSVVYYEWPGMGRIAHVGLVETVHPDGSWTAIEGNTDGGGSRTGGRVMRQHRQPGSLGARGGFGHPAWTNNTTTPPRGFLMALTDQQQTDLYNAIDRMNTHLLRVLPDRTNPDGKPAHVLDTLDGDYLVRQIAGSTMATITEVSSAFHQEKDRDAAAQAQLAAQLAGLDPERVAAALVTALGTEGATTVASRITAA